MTTKEIETKAKKLKPTESEISQFTAVKKNGMRSLFSVYKQGNSYFIAKGLLFNVRQNHEIVKKSQNYNTIVKFLIMQCNS